MTFSLWSEAVLPALRFQDPQTGGLLRLDDGDWRELLPLCDRSQLTLVLEQRVSGLPGWVKERIETDLDRNRSRTRSLRESFAGIAERLVDRGIDFTVLKGFAQFPDYVTDLSRRVQYDLDLYMPRPETARARDVLLDLDYEPVGETEALPTDHLPAMVRKTGWRWRGDYFDPEIPLAVDLHFRLWDQETEGFDAPGWEQFWSRRLKRDWDGLTFGALHPADALAYNALHLLRHLLRGSLRLYHVYELACFLHMRAGDEQFWTQRRELHGDRLRGLEAIAFRLASEWFHCAVSPAVTDEIEQLPEPIAQWFERYALAPVEGLFEPNKHELWLHLSLLDSGGARLRVLRRRLLPLRLPAHDEAAFVPDQRKTLRLRWESWKSFGSHLLRRVVHHARVLPSVVWHGSRWWWRASDYGGLGSAFWSLVGAASIFNFGAFLFVLLYNLYLLDLGYREDVLGLVAAAFTAGSIAGTLPAGRLSQQLGLRRTLASCFALTAANGACRAVFTGQSSLMVFAFFGGLLFAVFAVCMAPAVAQLTSDRNRPRGFSVFFASGIAVGVLGGLAGGRLPALLAAAAAIEQPATAKRVALLLGCALIALAAWPASRLRLAGGVAGRRTYPAGSFVWRFLLVIGVWGMATGAFNPFFNAYFARTAGASVEQIGLAFAAGQVAQVAALILAPVALRRFGLIRGITGMQLATGAALGALALVPALRPGVALAAALYAVYMGFQYMSEPGLYSLLMNRVKPEQHSGASALNFLVIFTGQAAAAAMAGALVSSFGYSPVLAGAAAVAVLAGLLLRWLLPDRSLD